MRFAALALAGAIVLTTPAFAQTHVFGSTAPASVDLSAKKKKRMKHQQVKQVLPGSGAEAGPNNSTGNMNTKGAGRGTTGTGGRGGSGNE